MSFTPVSLVRVYYLQETEKIFVGRLALKKQRIFFEYEQSFLRTNIELSPFKLSLKAGIVSGDPFLFEGLFGVFNDSLPDGWGRLLLDRKLMNLGINAKDLSPLDRLCYVGNRGMGALVYEPEIEDFSHPGKINLDVIAKEVLDFQVNNTDDFVEHLFSLSGTSVGARPKILLDDWIIKFRALTDPKDMGAIEFAYHLMAKEAKLDLPRAKLFPAKQGYGYFGVKRFDRSLKKRLHMHSVAGLLHIDHRIPSLDYETLMKLTAALTKNIVECEKQFRTAVFNVLAYNRDDHAKNFSFIMNENTQWHVSPAYDLTFSSGPAGEHCTTVMGEGKKPTLSHLLKLGNVCGIKKDISLEIIDEVKSAIAKWTKFAKEAGVTNSSSTLIAKTLKFYNS